MSPKYQVNERIIYRCTYGGERRGKVASVRLTHKAYSYQVWVRTKGGAAQKQIPERYIVGRLEEGTQR